MNGMKKMISAGLALLMLTGCKDATAALANSGETIMTVGDTSVTKGELYDMLFATVGADTEAGDDCSVHAVDGRGICGKADPPEYPYR